MKLFLPNIPFHFENLFLSQKKFHLNFFIHLKGFVYLNIAKKYYLP